MSCRCSLYSDALAGLVPQLFPWGACSCDQPPSPNVQCEVPWDIFSAIYLQAFFLTFNFNCFSFFSFFFSFPVWNNHLCFVCEPGGCISQSIFIQQFDWKSAFLNVDSFQNVSSWCLVEGREDTSWFVTCILKGEPSQHLIFVHSPENPTTLQSQQGAKLEFFTWGAWSRTKLHRAVPLQPAPGVCPLFLPPSFPLLQQWGWWDWFVTFFCCLWNAFPEVFLTGRNSCASKAFFPVYFILLLFFFFSGILDFNRRILTVATRRKVTRCQSQMWCRRNLHRKDCRQINACCQSKLAVARHL